MKLIIHAGNYKTGTTSIQTSLFANRKKLAKEQRLFIPPSLSPEYSCIHIELTQAIQESNETEGSSLLERYFVSAIENNCDKILITSEGLFDLKEFLLL